MAAAAAADPAFVLELEAAYLEELDLDPQAEYAQVLAQARSYAASRPPSKSSHGNPSRARPTTPKERATKVYLVPQDKPKSSSSWWKHLVLFWRKSSSKSPAAPAASPHKTKKKKRSALSGPVVLYTDGIREQPFHNRSKHLSGPLKISSAISCRSEDDALVESSPYVPLHAAGRASIIRPLYVSS